MARTPIALTSEAIRRPVKKIEIAWDGNAYTDESARVVALDGVSEITAPDAGASAVGAAIADSCRIVLNNTDNRFSANNSSAALYAQLNRNANPNNAGGYFRPVRVSLGFYNSGGSPEYLQVFQGVIINPQERWQDRTYTLDCLDRWAVLKRKRASTGLFENKRTDELIQEWLNASGLGYAANLEKSERLIRWAWLGDDSIAEDMIRLVEADGGLVYFDYAGTLQYKTASWFARNTASVETFTTARFEALEPEWDFDQVYDRVTVHVTPRYVAVASVLWSSDEVITLEPSGQRVIEAHFREPAYTVVTPGYNQIPASSDWEALTAANQALENGSGGSLLTVALSNVLAQSATVTLTNGSATQRMYVTKLQLRGQPVVAGKEILVNEPSSGSATQVLSLDNPYYQSRTQAEAVAKALQHRFRYPRQTVQLTGVPARPHLDVTDRVTVQETDTGISRDFFIARKQYRFSLSDGYVEDYDLVDAADYLPYSNYFVIGTTGLGTAGRYFW